VSAKDRCSTGGFLSRRPRQSSDPTPLAACPTAKSCCYSAAMAKRIHRIGAALHGTSRSRPCRIPVASLSRPCGVSATHMGLNCDPHATRMRLTCDAGATHMRPTCDFRGKTRHNPQLPQLRWIIARFSRRVGLADAGHPPNGQKAPGSLRRPCWRSASDAFALLVWQEPKAVSNQMESSDDPEIA
jgi:hypothetical protein